MIDKRKDILNLYAVSQYYLVDNRFIDDDLHYILDRFDYNHVILINNISDRYELLEQLDNYNFVKAKVIMFSITGIVIVSNAEKYDGHTDMYSISIFPVEAAPFFDVTKAYITKYDSFYLIY